MGWAQRQRQAALADGQAVTRGNPTPAVRRMVFIDAHKVDLARRRGVPFVRVAFSDRAYALDARGTLHRLPPPRPEVSSAAPESTS